MEIAMLILTAVSTLTSIISLIYAISIKKEVKNYNEKNVRQKSKGNDNIMIGISNKKE